MALASPAVPPFPTRHDRRTGPGVASARACSPLGRSAAAPGLRPARSGARAGRGARARPSRRHLPHRPGDLPRVPRLPRHARSRVGGRGARRRPTPRCTVRASSARSTSAVERARAAATASHVTARPDGSRASSAPTARSPTCWRFPSARCIACRTTCRTRTAVFAEPVAAAFEILEQLGDVDGMRAVVLGDGKLGLLVAQVLAASGARVTLAGRHAGKLDVARRLGTRHRLSRSRGRPGRRRDRVARRPPRKRWRSCARAARWC